MGETLNPMLRLAILGMIEGNGASLFVVSDH